MGARWTGIYIDKHVVEVFANDRQAVLSNHYDYQNKTDLRAWTVGAATRLKTLEVWWLEPTNQGFFEAQKSRIWEPKTK